MIMVKNVNNNKDHEYHIHPMLISYILSKDFFFEDILTKLNEMIYMAKQLCLKCNNYILTEKIR